LQSKYQALNREFFDNSLPKVRIEWADLTDYNYLGETYRENDGTFVVLVDRRTNLQDEVLQDTVFHEMCHVATWRQQDDPHGSAFRACMAGIQGKAVQDISMKAR
jgi:predicted SprT family Zn-dependent metalloprotease